MIDFIIYIFGCAVSGAGMGYCLTKIEKDYFNFVLFLLLNISLHIGVALK
jgi:hypothetical protein